MLDENSGGNFHGEQMKMVEATADERLGGDFDMEQMQHVLVMGLWCPLPNGAE